MAAWWIAGRLARQTLLPLLDLVDQIRGIDPLAPARRPVARTGDADVDAIPDAVNALVRELDHVLQRERAFADAASHELRTPLAVVHGAIDVLRERGDPSAAVVERMDRAARRAQEDLEALLAMSPAREPAPPAVVELRDLLPAAADPYLRDGATRVQVAWSWSTPSEARVDPAALAIVFTNLLRNALRGAGGHDPYRGGRRRRQHRGRRRRAARGLAGGGRAARARAGAPDRPHAGRTPRLDRLGGARSAARHAGDAADRGLQLVRLRPA